MEIVSIVVTAVALIATVVFGHFQLVVPFIRKEVRWSKKFPFIESTEVPLKRRRKKKRSRWLIPVMAILVIIVVIVLTRVLLLQAADLPRKPIAIMQFKNLTGDAQYDYLCEAIPNLLITNLEQSDRLQVMTWERMHDLLKQLDKEELEIIDEETGFELCRMDDVNTIVVGSFTKAGDVFVTDIKILDVSSKKLLKTANSKGAGVASILKLQVDDLSKDIARHASLFERTTAPTQMQVMEVTTSSMEAYNYFLKGREENSKFYWADARKFFEKAIEIDTSFASAYLALAESYRYMTDIKSCNAALTKANALSGRVTEKERLWIKARYVSSVEGNIIKYYAIIQEYAKKYPKEKNAHVVMAKMYRDKGLPSKEIQELLKALELDPNDGGIWHNLGYSYADIGAYTKAIDSFKRYAHLSPGNANPFDSMGDIYFEMGQPDDALAQYKQAIFVKPDFHAASDKSAYIYALREDYTEALKCIDFWASNVHSSAQTAAPYWNKAFYGQLLGHAEKAHRDLDMARMLWESTANETGVALVEIQRALIYYHQGMFQQGQTHLQNYYNNNPAYLGNVATPNKRLVYNFFLGLMEVRQKNFDSAKTMIDALGQFLTGKAKQDKYVVQLRVIQNNDWPAFLHDILYAELLLAQDSIDKSITVSENTSKYRVIIAIEDAQIATHVPQDVTARAYIKKGDIDNAIRAYERLTDADPNKHHLCLIHPTFRYELAKLYEEKGLKIKAIEQYEKFLDLWKDADPDRPEPHDARKRLAKLKA